MTNSPQIMINLPDYWRNTDGALPVEPREPGTDGRDIRTEISAERVWGRMTPEALRIAIRMALTELLLSGCTTAADHHNLFPPNLKDAIDIEVEEATKLGIRMTVTRGSMGISEKDGGLQPDSIVQDSETILEDSERVLRAYHDPKPGAMIRVALAPCSPLAVPTPLAGKLRELTPSELDTFQLVLDHGQLQKVLDNFPGTDLDAAQNIISLMKREFVVVP